MPTPNENGIWGQISNLARWTPSPHNTQPFRIRPTDDGRAELLCVCDRMLPEEDHGNLYLAAAFGTFAVGLELAAARCGHEISIEPASDIEPASLYQAGTHRVMGHAVLSPSGATHLLAEFLEPRRTSRLQYDGRRVDVRCIEGLTRVANEHGQRFLSYDDPTRVQWVLNTNTQAIIDNLQITNERQEIRQWYRRGATPETGDGLWQVPMNQSSWEMTSAFSTPWLLKLPGIRGFVGRRFLKTQDGTRGVGLLCGPFQTWPELYAAGRMLMEFWLEMARFDVYMHPYGSMLTNPRFAAAVAQKFGVKDAWLIFRFGYSEVPPRSPRLASLLMA